ncbi:unnamed protein product [marine sediment metagenome]|uniref:Uncharacterized protein n=1 Tax=marine sediment metagenome TaxID=412755 RepID=X0WAJ5_9ZZZZ
MLIEHIIFLQDNEAIIPLDMIASHGKEEAIEYLQQWDFGGGERFNYSCWGKGDITYNQGDLILAYNALCGYISLYRKLG